LEFRADGSSAQLSQGGGYYTINHVDEGENQTILSATYEFPESYYTTTLNRIVRDIQIIIELQSNDELRIRITDANRSRPEIDNAAPFPNDRAGKPYAERDVLYEVSYLKKPMSIAVTRRATREVIFSTEGFEFIFSEHYIQFETTLPTRHLFGLGERGTRSFQFMEGTQTINPRDQPDAFEDGTPGNNLYGHHPMYLSRERSGDFHIILLRNPSAMDVRFGRFGPNQEHTLQFRLVPDQPERCLTLVRRFMGSSTSSFSLVERIRSKSPKSTMLTCRNGS
jgi:alpha-glucosidase